MYPYPSETAEQPSKQRAQHTGTRTLTVLYRVCVCFWQLYTALSRSPCRGATLGEGWACTSNLLDKEDN